MRRATRWPGRCSSTALGKSGIGASEQQRYRASGLNLVTAAIVLWNTVYLERATQGLVEAGKPVDGELLQFLSPLGWEHINLTGDYVWRQSRRLEDGKFRPLRMPGKNLSVRFFPNSAGSPETHGLPGYTGIHFFLAHYRQTLFRTGTFRERVEQKGLHN
ncbi:Tn3 family transposase [Klebsiella pneumoniae]